jgi:CobQ-like glutamine amidotransferase family enzyme
MPDLELRIAHLYAHFLNIYGDRGNIITLAKRAQWRGIKVAITPIDIGMQIDHEYFDFYFIGGGQDKQQQSIAEDLIKRADTLKKSVENGAVILSVCGGYQLLGHYYRPHEGPELRGISLINAYTVAGNRRMIGNVVVKREDGSTLVGFENHSGKTFLEEGVRPLGKAIVGNGNNGDDRFEGAQYKTVYGTYLHGSILPKNPLFADELLKQSLSRRYGDIELAALDDTLELSAHSRATSLPA